MDQLLLLPTQLLQNYDLVWSFLLVFFRFCSMLVIMPGIGNGTAGLAIRVPGALMMSYAATVNATPAHLPTEFGDFFLAIFSEIIFGMALGSIPAMVVAGMQMALQLTSTTMGLSAGQMYDASMGISLTSLGIFGGNVAIGLFLLMGGHHHVIYAVSGLGGEIIPGTFLINDRTITLIIDRVGLIFTAGTMISAPVIVAILLTKFVMGLVTRAVPQVNIFIIAFPLTIGIGLIITALSLPEVGHYLERDFRRAEQEIIILTDETQHIDQS